MADSYEALRTAIRESMPDLARPEMAQAAKAARSTLIELADEGVIELGPDHRLSDVSLEIRVKHILKGIGLDVALGREGLEDYVVTPPEGSNPHMPLVVEVKASRKPMLTRVELRQLDDWIYDLSGEEKIREGMWVGTPFLTPGRRVTNPTPHKGVLIFNGPISHDFSNRTGPCVNPNDEEFIKKRRICIIPGASGFRVGAVAVFRRR